MYMNVNNSLFEITHFMDVYLGVSTNISISPGVPPYISTEQSDRTLLL